MHLPVRLRSALAIAFSSFVCALAFVLVPACSSSPPDEASEEGTAESALNGCGHVGPGGVIVDRAPDWCVPGTIDYTTAGCAHRNARRPRLCGSDCLHKAYGACECTPSCAGRVCGDDGCGGSCGTCSASQACSQAGDKCFPYWGGGGSSSGGGGGGAGSCGTKNCGPDGAGGSCGSCAFGSTCVAGHCSAPAPTCSANGTSCSVDGQCCSSRCYVGTGSCVLCKPSTAVAYCSKDFECCSGLCDTYYVACVNVCKHNTAACTSNTQCCSGHCAAGSCL